MTVRDFGGTVAVLSLVLMFSGPPARAWAAGFAVFTQGASALGQGNAVTAHVDGPSAVFFNPALIGRLDGTQVEMGTTMLVASRKFASDLSGETFETDSGIFFPSTFYATRKLGDRLSAGLGVFNPFGLGNDWGEEWEGRYIATNSELTTYNINPAVSWRLLPAVTVAAGVDLLLLDATLERNLRLTPLPDARQKFTGDGTGIGYNFGAIFDLSKDISLGAAYRSEIEVKIDGKASFDLPPGTPPELRSALGATGAEADLTLPSQFTAGVHYRGLAPLSFEVGVRWEGWSSFDRLEIELDNGQTSVTERKWRDSLAYNAGASYRLNDTVTLLAGYLYGNSPVPDRTFEPAIPDADTHVFSVGTDLDLGRARLALAYAYQMFENREKENEVGAAAGGAANGTYESELHLVGVSVGYRF